MLASADAAVNPTTGAGPIQPRVSSDTHTAPLLADPAEW
jgi:hypothetical protein